jgi:UDP-galactopyranose mutase
MIYDYLIVGAGLSGCVIAERIAAELDKKVLIIDRRPHIAGNCFDYQNESGIFIHKFGPHAFHTSKIEVWEYLSRFINWINYEHKVLAQVEDKRVPVPVNFNSIEILFYKTKAKKIQEKLLSIREFGDKIPILELLSVKDELLNEFARYIFDNVFLGYTVKQWGLSPQELDPSVTGRIPVSISRDDRYFQDRWQAIPEIGYTGMIKNIINHKNIELVLNTDFASVKNVIIYKNLIYTGSIDEYFNYEFGELPYRSLDFKLKTLEQEYFQEVAQVNYPNDHDYTRITEFKHFNKFKSPKTTIAYEYPRQFVPGGDEPYYPIPVAKNVDLYLKYSKLAEQTAKDVIFLGRLGEYRYYNMDDIVSKALKTFEEKIAPKN